MKIDDKIISYELAGNLRNQALGDADKVEKERSAAGDRASEQAPAKEDAIVRLSDASRDAQKIREIVTSQPAVREDRVASLREKIASGDYTMDYDGVADKLVNAFLDDLI
jgi:flagellar biosynthesis anti-sigma factor FlgM